MSALIWSPFPDAEAAEAAARTLLAERLVACANILPAMRSLFVWQGTAQDSTETGALFKTDAALLARAIARLGELHPYASPAILGWRCDAAHPATAQWLAALTQPPGCALSS